MSEWKPIETAPKDGTCIRVRNAIMKGSVIVKWGIYRWGNWVMDAPRPKPVESFVLVEDDRADILGSLRPGSLVVPDEWMPLSPPQTVSVNAAEGTSNSVREK